MSTIPQVSDAMQWVLNEYRHIIERETGFVQRDSPLNGIGLRTRFGLGLDGGTRRKLFAIAQFDCDTWSACQ